MTFDMPHPRKTTLRAGPNPATTLALTAALNLAATLDSAVAPHTARQGCRQSRHTQAGSALFTAMMLLIILSLLALSAATVTAMQERMAGSYRAEHHAFEHTEARLRSTERALLTETDPCHAVNPDPSESWLESTPPAAAQNYRNMGRGDTARAFGWRGSSRAGQPAVVGDIRCAYFEVTAIDFDLPGAGATADAITTSVYVP